MRRRTLDSFFVIGGFALAALLATLGFVLQSNADFANDYVHNQLSQQKIVFTPTAALSPAEKTTTCLVSNQRKVLTTGPQAECYANRYIALHLSEVNDGKTYAETSGESRAVKTAADEAKASGAANAATLAQTATVLDGKTQTLFRGETLRGLLLTSYGFSEFGRKAEQAATVAFIAALVLLLASVAGTLHLLRTPKAEIVK